MAIASAGGGQSNVYSLPTVRLQAVGNAIHVNCRLIDQDLSGSAIAPCIVDNYFKACLQRRQFFRAKILAVDG